MPAETPANPVSDANRDGYDRWAPIYDDYVNSTIAVDSRAFPPLWAHVTDRKVLEIGCGTGRHTATLAQQGNLVTAVDLSPGMLAIARQKLGDAGNVRLIEADVMVDAIDGGPFDTVVTALVLEHIRDLPRFFARAAALMADGGEMFVSEIHPDKSAAGSGARFVDPETGEERWLTNFPHSGASIIDAAAAAGLTCTRERDVLGDESLAAQRPEWARYLGKPMIRMWAFRRT